MPVSDGRALAGTIGKVLSLLWLLVLLQFPSFLAQHFPPFSHPQNSNNIRKNEQDTFLNSHILEQEMEKSVYLFHGKTKNFTFTFRTGGLMTMVVTPCASEVQWSVLVKPSVGSDYRTHGQKIPRMPRVQLAQFQNESRQVFQKMDAQAGRYTVCITSLHSDSNVKILVTRNITSHVIYPELPADRTVHAKIRKRKLIVSWSPTVMTGQWSQPVKYCISISQIKNFKTHCAALAHRYGDKRPRYTRWGFPGEKQRIRELKKMANPIKKVKKKLMFYQCVHGTTSFTYKKLRRGRKYFIDVFLVDQNSNGSSAYLGTSVERKKRKRKQKRNFAHLEMDKTRTVNLKHTRGVQITVNKTVPGLVIEVVPCSGQLPLVIYYKRLKLKSAINVRRWKRIIVTTAKAGTYLVAFLGKRKKSSYVSISASGYPKSKVVLPTTMNVSVQKSITSCSNVTLQWMESRARQSYCLYKQVVSDSVKGRGAKRLRCLSPSERPKSELVFCERRKSKNHMSPRPYTVTGLAPSTSYRFDLFVGNKKSAMVPYQSVKETTAQYC